VESRRIVLSLHVLDNAFAGTGLYLVSNTTRCAFGFKPYGARASALRWCGGSNRPQWSWSDLKTVPIAEYHMGWLPA
jgi:hypothetical protein